MNLSLLKNHTIAVLMGGPGGEREVSIASGTAVARALRGAGFSVINCDIKDRNVELPQEVTFVMNMIHGTFGEDGELQALLEKKGIPYSGAGVKASQLAINKIKSKKRFLEAGVPTAPFEILHEGEHPSLLVPYVIKAPQEGSTLGLYIIHENDPEKINNSLHGAFEFGNEILVEEFVLGRELTVGILGDDVLPIIEIKAKDGVYDFKN
jgi:D-alanine-D-alanine ligase